MSSKENTKVKYRYIYTLPYPERRALTQLLDADGKWEDLGGYIMKVNQIELSLMGQARYRNESPTNLLLEKFGQRNGTIDELFIMLSKLEHYRAMQILVEYVNPKYHHLLRGNRTTSYGIYSATNVLPSPIPSLIPEYLRMDGAVKMTTSEIEKVKFLDDKRNFDSKTPLTVLSSKMSGMDISRNTNHGKLERESTILNNATESQSQNGMSPTGLVGVINHHFNQTNRAEAACNNTSQEVKKLNIPVSDVLLEKKSNPKTISVKNELFTKAEDMPQVMQIPHREILKATNNFDETRILGRGGFGIVYKGEWKGINVAIKKLEPKNKPAAGDTAGQEVSLKQSLTEMRILNSCRIDNILPLYGVCLSSPQPCIVYQFMINGSLEDRLLCKDGTTPLNWTQRAEIADGTAKGLNYLHSLPDKPLVHGDIKSANILLDSDMKAKIGDFGLAREGPASQYTHIKVSSVHGTQVYLPPEYLRQSHLSPKVDVYSYGIVLLEICTGQRAFNDRRPKNKLLLDYVGDIIKMGDTESLRDPKAGVQVMEWFDEMLRLGQKCSQKLKSKRPDMAEVLKVFEQAKQAIIRTERIRKLSKETNMLPLTPQLSPLELQVWYDIQNGPNFMPLPRMNNGPSNFNGNNSNANPDEMPPNFASTPHFTGFHPSEIRAPPSVVEPDAIYVQDTSCQATAGSENSIVSPNSETDNGPTQCLSNNSDSLPCLTILGTKPPEESFFRPEMSELGPTPHPSGILSDTPCFRVDSLLNLDSE